VPYVASYEIDDWIICVLVTPLPKLNCRVQAD
jgi:hypothetical protein